jgi:hypothetical protein
MTGGRMVGMARRLGLCVMVALWVLCVTAGATAASGGSAAWRLELLSSPTVFAAGDSAGCLAELNVNFPLCDALVFTATDVGAAAGDGSPVVLSAVVPAGLRVRRVSLRWSGYPEENGRAGESDLEQKYPGLCTLTPARCEIPASLFEEHGGPIHPDDRVKMTVYVTVDEPVVAGSEAVSGEVSGGGAGLASASGEVGVGLEDPGFGLSLFSSAFFDGEGAASVQAGGHPYENSTRIALNNVIGMTSEGSVFRASAQDLKDVVVDLPLGMVGSALAAPTCTLAQMSDGEEGGCPAASVVGRIVTDPEGTNTTLKRPVYHLVSEHGVAAEYGFTDPVAGTHVLYAGLAPTPAGYVLRVTGREVSQIALTDVLTSFFGEPAVRDGVGGASVPMFTNPSDCSGQPLLTDVYVDSWQAPGGWSGGQPDLASPGWVSASSSAPPVVGCDLLRFSASIQTRLETQRADTPTGLQVNVKVPQSTAADTLGTPPLRNVEIRLPAGMAVNPAAANGLEACSLAQAGVSSGGEPNAAAPSCPAASKIGDVELETPALAGVLHGAIYLAKQTENPFGSLLALYMIVNDPATGLLVKIPGRIQADPATGQLTTFFEGLPQFPASEVRVHLFGGQDAPLRTPSTCGAYTISSTLTPWSAPDSGPATEASSGFTINEGAQGTACATSENQLPYHPSLVAGTTSDQAAAYSPFTLTLSRADQEQLFSTLSVTLPPGLIGAISHITPCPEPAAAQGSCGQESLLGDVSAAVGAGSEPYWVKGGQAYLTGPYQNSPFGLSIVVPTTAGPYTLTGNGGPGREIIRASINIDPHTAQVTVTSQPLPSILEGIPLQIKTIHIEINREKFILNPTSCQPMNITATTTSTQNTTTALSYRYQAANCANLPFHPTFTATSHAKHTRRYGAYLHTLITSGPGQANLKSITLSLPKIMPSRQDTLHLSCVAETYNNNPAACPPGSHIGSATVHTPILKTPLTGPLILVSHGGAGFPDLHILLQTENITIDQTGHINIQHNITTLTFPNIPDAPTTNIEVTTPPGPHSILTATTNLCTTTTHKHHKTQHHHRTIHLPTTLTGQNNTTTKPNTTIHITGCPKPKAHKHQPHKHGTRHKKK